MYLHLESCLFNCGFPSTSQQIRRPHVFVRIYSPLLSATRWLYPWVSMRPKVVAQRSLFERYIFRLALLGSVRSALDLEGNRNAGSLGRRVRLVPLSSLSTWRRLVRPLQGHADLLVAAPDTADVWTARLRSTYFRPTSLGVGVHSIDIRKCSQRRRLRLVREARSVFRVRAVSGGECAAVRIPTAQTGRSGFVELGGGLRSALDCAVLELSRWVSPAITKVNSLIYISFLVGVLYSIIFCGILMRTPEVSQQQKKAAMHTAIGNSATVLPILVFQVIFKPKNPSPSLHQTCLGLVGRYTGRRSAMANDSRGCTIASCFVHVGSFEFRR